jgi:hypothetical protein
MSPVERRSDAPVRIELGGSDTPDGASERMRVVRAQLEHLFPPAPFPLHLGYGPPPSGFVEVDAWRVIPSRSAPRFLVPVDPAAASRIVVSHNRLRAPTVAAVRRLAAIAIRPLAMVQGAGTVLRLSAPAGVGEAELDAAVITRQLRRRLPEAVGTAISLRDFHPRAKPTVQLTDDHGTVVAFAKVASDPATAERVLTEADLLERLGTGLEGLGLGPRGPLRLPRVLDSGRSGPFAYSVVEPLPQHARRIGEADEPRVLQALAAFGTCLGPVRTMPLAQTALWDDVLARAHAAQAARGARPELVEGLDRLLATALRHDAATLVPAGAYHGDWTPWNMGQADEVIWAWDLEYGSPQGPLGLDALRWVFQVQHVTAGASFTQAVAAMTAAAPHLLPVLGVPVALTTPLVRFHVIETMASALGLLASGRGLPTGLDPDAVDVMRSLEHPHVPPLPRRPA